MLELFVCEVIFAVLVTKFELGGFGFTKNFLEGIKIFKVFDEGRTLIIVAFVDRAIFAVFPEVECMVAVRTPEFSFVSMAAMQVK